MTAEAQAVQYTLVACAVNGTISFMLMLIAGAVFYVEHRNKPKTWSDVKVSAFVMAVLMALVTWRQALGVINAYVAPEMVLNGRMSPF